MSPLLPKKGGKRSWADDPGHIHDQPTTPPMPDEQEQVGVEVPPREAPAQGTAAPPGGRYGPEVEAAQPNEPERDPAPVPQLSEVDVPEELAEEIRTAISRYPEPRSASIPALWAVQRRYGWCTPEGIEQAAAVMGVTPGYLQSVASFYDLFQLEPRGDHQVLVCTNISCWLRGADDLLERFKEAATQPPIRSTRPEGTPGGSAGEAEQPPDVMVRPFECLGACDLAPMASIDERYYGPLEAADAEAAISQLRSGEDVLPAKRLQDRKAAGSAEEASG